MREYLFLMVVAAAVTYLATPMIRRVAQLLRAMTPVRDRDVHAVPTPRLGGVAMFAGLAASLLIGSRMPFLSRAFQDSSGPLWVLVAGGVICLVGVADDIWGLDAVTKLAGQVLAAAILALQGVRLLSLPVAGVTLLSSQTLILLTALVVVVTINAVNFIDGLDGLAAGIVGIGGLAFFIYSYKLSRDVTPDDLSSLATLVAAVTVGCCLGFLPHNANPARIFMGDSGSMLIGLLLACCTIAVSANVDPTQISQQRIAPAFFPVLLPIAVLLIPFGDLLLAVLRRTRAGRSPFAPDKQHLHHRLLELGHSHRHAVLIMYAWAAILSFGVVLAAFWPLASAAAAVCAVAVLALAVTMLPRLRRRARQRTGSAG